MKAMAVLLTDENTVKWWSHMFFYKGRGAVEGFGFRLAQIVLLSQSDSGAHRLNQTARS